MFEDKFTETSLISVESQGGLVQPPTHVTALYMAAESTVRQLISDNAVLPREAHMIVSAQTLSYILSRDNHTKFSCPIHASR